MKVLRSLFFPLAFLIAGGLIVGLGKSLINLPAASRWVMSTVKALPLFGGSEASDSDYAAVYLVGGKVYFGKLHDSRSDAPSLTDVFLLSVSQTPSSVGSETQDDEEKGATVEPAQQFDYELVKLTDQLQKPSDELILSRDQILFWEPLQSDSRVVAAIEKYHASTTAE